ncbi:glutamine-hydrolyzing GMP synthase [Candidatus Daviesbacteria bacterium]|nr:glutamine-hydrolyzing GMP synthase [Candidatus Daviesbacteria bacterium]
MIILVDFGGQTAHLISRRIRELGIECTALDPEESLQKIKELKPKGIIFSGGPASVYEKSSPTVDKKTFDLQVPILGICYGEQLITYLLGGKVKPGKKEYGPATLIINKSSKLLKGIPENSKVWMSHGDEVEGLPKGFVNNGKTQTIPHAAISNEKKKIYAIQFHPEVIHTEFGMEILENFIKICGLKIKKRIINREFIENIIQDIKDSIGGDKAICALSGGVDSAVAAALVREAIGENLQSIYIDSGLMRDGDAVNMRNVKIIDAGNQFLKALKGVSDPEEKRKIIGKAFIEVFETVAKKSGAKFLVQGTIYPDVIESAGSKHSQVIKSHHNVGGLPKEMSLTLVEPLRNFYKDEVRQIGKILGLPESITQRQPFPGPGLAVRIIGEVTERKLEILRKADKILQEELRDYQDSLWQAFTVFTSIKTTGIRGDNRAYGETIAIRAIEAKDAMSANFAKLSYTILDKISTRIVNEVPQVNRVVYDITNKPPATMEWE